MWNWSPVSFQACYQPILDNVHHSPVPRPPVFPSPPCSNESNWVSVHKGGFIISPDASTRHGTISCTCTSLMLGMGSEGIHTGDTFEIRNNSLILSDVFVSNCSAADGSVYVHTHSSVMWNRDFHRRKNWEQDIVGGIGLNVLVIGVASMSRLGWSRHLKKTHTYVTTDQGAVVLRGYNIVGDPLEGLLAAFTSPPQGQYPGSNPWLEAVQEADDLPWLFQDFHGAGYVTQWGEDIRRYGSLRFKVKPVDHFMGPFYVNTRQNVTSHAPCIDSDDIHNVLFQNVMDLFEMYPRRPKFSYIFHDTWPSDNIDSLDQAMYSFLRTMEQRSFLNSTLLVLLSDRGYLPEVTAIPPGGKWEQRLPYLALRVPTWFQETYPKAMTNLRINSNRLTTPYDLYATLKDVLHYTQPQNPRHRDSRHKDKTVVRPSYLYDGNRNTSKDGLYSATGQSWFQEMPWWRSCADAGVHSFWCACLDFPLGGPDLQPVIEQSPKDRLADNLLPSPVRTCKDYLMSWVDYVYTLLKIFVANWYVLNQL